MSFHFILIFSITVFIASIIPGPSMLLALSHGMSYGAGKTVASALGNATVTLIQAAVSFAGLGTLLLASENLFNCVKWAGAAYLIYMGITMLLTSGSFTISTSADNSQSGSRWKTARKLYLQSAVVTAGNPKAIIFFTAVFPQFINPDAGYLIQCSVLMTICVMIAFGCYMAYAVCGHKLLSLFSEASAGRIIRRAIGGTFIGAGIGLAASNRI